MWHWCANTPRGWVEKSQSPSWEQLAEEHSQHKMPEAKFMWPNVFDFISAEGLFSSLPETVRGCILGQKTLLLLMANFSQHVNHSLGISVVVAGDD